MASTECFARSTSDPREQPSAPGVAPGVSAGVPGHSADEWRHRRKVKSFDTKLMCRVLWMSRSGYYDGYSAAR
jgi:hypothetical protein